jgi:hypothetical protein
MNTIKIEKPDQNKLKNLKIDTWNPWECKPSEFDWEYSDQETCYIFDGRVTVKTESGSEVEIKKGDLVTFPKGLKCKWRVIETIKKVYTFEK